jgi:hypothetical protein
MSRRTLILAGLLALAAGCQPPARTADVPPGPKSPTGWEVRYNAALALARRGSEQVRQPDVWDTLVEMLDEQQQFRNFTAQLRDGRVVPDETAARLTVIGALKAVQELHRQRPGLDLSGLREPIAKLAHSASPPVAAEAKQTQLTLGQTS